MTLAGVKVHRVDGRYRYQPPTLKFACVRVLDHNIIIIIIIIYFLLFYKGVIKCYGKQLYQSCNYSTNKRG